MSATESNRTAKELTKEAQVIRDELMGSEEREVVLVHLYAFDGQTTPPPDVVTDDGTIIRIVLHGYLEEAVEG